MHESCHRSWGVCEPFVTDRRWNAESTFAVAAGRAETWKMRGPRPRSVVDRAIPVLLVAALALRLDEGHAERSNA
jgi:hypothetical protein